MITLRVNGVSRTVDAEPDTPLLYVLRNDLALHGPRFGCGLAQCGACTVIMDGAAVRSCVTPAARAAGRKVTTLEGLGSVEKPHPVQRAFIEEQAVQCGYYVKYENVRTYVAAVAEVEADRRSGAVRVKRVVVAHDCGLVINPDGVRAQIEGNVVQTVSRALKEELKWDRSRVTSVDWATYPILTFPEAPEVDIELISRPSDPAWGAGEPAAAVIPSAVSNAVFDAIGVRLRTVPFTPDRVKAAARRQT